MCYFVVQWFKASYTADYKFYTEFDSPGSLFFFKFKIVLSSFTYNYGSDENVKTHGNNKGVKKYI